MLQGGVSGRVMRFQRSPLVKCFVCSRVGVIACAAGVAAVCMLLAPFALNHIHFSERNGKVHLAFGGHGYVSLQSAGEDADVFVNEQRRGKLSGGKLELSLPEGVHVVRLSQVGFDDAERRVAVNAAQTTVVRFELHRSQSFRFRPPGGAPTASIHRGSLYVITDIPGARIRLNGFAVNGAKTPVIVDDLAPQIWSIHASLNGIADMASVAVASGEMTEVHLFFDRSRKAAFLEARRVAEERRIAAKRAEEERIAEAARIDRERIAQEQRLRAEREEKARQEEVARIANERKLAEKREEVRVLISKHYSARMAEMERNLEEIIAIDRKRYPTVAETDWRPTAELERKWSFPVTYDDYSDYPNVVSTSIIAEMDHGTILWPKGPLASRQDYHQQNIWNRNSYVMRVWLLNISSKAGVSNCRKKLADLPEEERRMMQSLPGLSLAELETIEAQMRQQK